MKEMDNEEVEDFIQDWHWDKKSHICTTNRNISIQFY